MTLYGVIFILSVLVILYAYIGFPMFVWCLARIAPEPVRRGAGPRKVSVVIAAYNEAANVQRRLRELLAMLDRLDPGSEIILVSDGSTDGTDQLAREMRERRIHVIQQPMNVGKAVCLNTGVEAAANEIIIFGDTRQEWASDAIELMLENFADPDVGAVSGDLVFRNKDGSLAGVGLYWKLEKWLRLNESRLHSSVQVAGAICAVRKTLYRPLPPGTILDDVAWPQEVAMQGYRVIHEPRAKAFDRLPDRARDEMRRKVRTLSGNFQLVARRPAIVLPWCNPTWLNVLCHKLLRLVVPWAMIAALVTSALSDERWLQVMFVLQLVGYAVAVVGTLVPALAKIRIVNAASALLVLNTAALLSWFVYFTGRSGRSWKKVAYKPQANASHAQGVPAGS